MIRTLIFILVLFIVDFYVFQAIRVAFRTSTFVQPRTIYLIYWSLCAFCYLVMLAGGIIDWHTWPKPVRTYLFAFVFISFFSKLFVVLFLLVDDVLRLFRWIGSLIYERFYDAPAKVEKVNTPGISRSDFLMKLGLLIGTIPFTSMIYGMLGSAYHYTIKRIKIKVPNLPESFSGFKIVQISDLHTGSFTSVHPVGRSVEMVMNEQPDIIFFTGDLVNDKSDEALPFIEMFSRLKAPYGVFSIFGNHDYGDYIQWESPQAKINNLEKLKRIHQQLGWRLMLDENARIEKDGDHIGIIGVQNWSTHLRFPKYGNMKKATAGFEPSSFNILLSHDPSHWRGEVLEKYPFVDLMLAGHTHGFQFGIEIPGFKWSPVQYIYKEWAGLYQQDSRYLYINRGLGFLAYPGRVGILPEITVIELYKS